MTNVLLTIAFVILIIFVNILFLLFALPKLIIFIEKLLRGEVFIGVVEMFLIVFSLTSITFLMVSLIMKAF